MPLSYVVTDGDGVTTNFAVPFQFLNQSHVHVYVANSEMAVTWVNSSTVQVVPAPPAGSQNVEIRRITPRDVAMVDYNNGSVLYDYDLDAGVLQSLFIAQEYFEQSVNNFPSGHTLDSHSDATVGESTVKGAMRIYGAGSKTKAIVATDGGILQGDENTSLGAKFLTVGTQGQTLEVDTNQSGKLAWKQGLRHLIAAVGDLLVGGAIGSANTLGIGANNEVLRVDDTQGLKLKWSSIFYGGTYHGPTINAAVTMGNVTSNGVTVLSGSGGNYHQLAAGVVSGSTLSGCTLSGTTSVSTTFSGTVTGGTFSSPTFSGTPAGNAIGTGALKTATGSASGTGAGSLAVNMNDYSFFPMTWDSGSVTNALANYGGGDAGTTVGRFVISAGAGGTHGARWRYVTASDNPEIWVAISNTTGEIMATWTSDDPVPLAGVPGVEMAGCTSFRLTAKDLEHLSILNTKSAEAESHIRAKGLRMQHQAYRALQLLTNDPAPSKWLYEHCVFNESTKRLGVK